MTYMEDYASYYEKYKRPFYKEFFIRMLDTRAKLKGQRSHYNFLHKWLFEKFLPSPYSDITIVDIDAGNAIFFDFDSPRIKRKIAIDKEKVYKDRFHERGIDFYQCDIERNKLPLSKASVDVITLNHVIEHIKDQRFVIKELRRVLKRGGILLIRTPDIEKLKDMFWHDKTHKVPFTKQTLSGLFRKSGFNILLNENFGYYIFLLSNILPVYSLSKRLGKEIICICRKR